MQNHYLHRLLVSAVVGAFTSLACTDVELQPVYFPGVVEGEYCTAAADTYDIPIRILLVIDTSRSMEINDPEGFRGKAVADLVTIYSSNENVSFGFVAFNTGALQVSDGFIDDPVEITTALNQLNVMEGFTNYIDALTVAQNMIDDDIAKVAAELALLEEAGEDTEFARPWYFVVFLSDGIPRMPGGVLQDTDQILWRVEELVDVPPEASGLTLHTAFLGAEDDSQRADAEALLQQMAQVGGGTYTSFESGEDIDFTVFSFEVKRMFDIKFFIAYNRTALLGDMTAMADSDSDGIVDLEEEELGTDPLAVDSDGDGCSDGFERMTGLDPLAATYCPCKASALEDSDNDGLPDCEERFLGYDPNRFDSDGDLFPDWLEARMGSNAGDGEDWKEDLDFDGVLTGDEIRRGTNPIRPDGELHERYAYKYAAQRTTPLGAAEACYRLEVDNIALAPTMELGDRAEEVNEIVLELIEAPEDAAEKIFYLRRHVLRLKRDRFPISAHFSIDDFETISEQDNEKTRED